MAAPPPAKLFHPLSPLHPHSSPSQSLSETGRDAQNILFPWNDAVTENIKEWFEALAKSHNTAPEYVFVGALIGNNVKCGVNGIQILCTLKLEDIIELEPTNLFAVCIGYISGSGKSQAYRMTVREPLQSLPTPLSSILVDDYMKKGLFMHLQKHEGRALLAHEELGAFLDLVQKRQLEGHGEIKGNCIVDSTMGSSRWDRANGPG